MPSLAVCRCLFRLMRRCFLGRWIFLSVSERFRLVWICHLFDYSTYIQFCVHWHGVQCLRRLVPNSAVVFRYSIQHYSLIYTQSIGSKYSCVMLLDWSLTIRWFNVISRTLVVGVLPLCRDNRCILQTVLDWDLGICEFDFQSHYYVHFWTNTLGKSMNSLSFLQWFK